MVRFRAAAAAMAHLPRCHLLPLIAQSGPSPLFMVRAMVRARGSAGLGLWSGPEVALGLGLWSGPEVALELGLRIVSSGIELHDG